MNTHIINILAIILQMHFIALRIDLIDLFHSGHKFIFNVHVLIFLLSFFIVTYDDVIDNGRSVCATYINLQISLYANELLK